MSRSYPRNRQARQKNPGSRQLIVAFAAFLAGYLVANFFDVASLTWWINKQLNAQPKQRSQILTKTKPSQQELPKPKFEFYTLLAKDGSAPKEASHRFNPADMPKENERANLAEAAATVVPRADAPKAASVAVATENKPVLASKPLIPPTPELVKPAAKATVLQAQPASKAISKEFYLIQVASFNKLQDAEHLKASLVLQGFDVNLSSTAQNNVIWYRVNVGPYASKEEASRAQATMSRGGKVRGIVRKVVT